jgi:hypothetical protein
MKAPPDQPAVAEQLLDLVRVHPRGSGLIDELGRRIVIVQ